MYLEVQKLSLACGERVTFFARAKKVTKESTFVLRVGCVRRSHIPVPASNGALPVRRWRVRKLFFLRPTF
jgi:hypothetical protein